MAPRKGSRRLSAEERALWSKVVSDATPLPGQKAPAGLSAPGLRKEPQKDPQKHPGKGTPDAPPSVLLPSFRVGEAAGAGASADRARAARTPAPPRMDAKSFKRMSRGKLEPEARIDLHGMTTAAAHAALAAFVLRAAADGRRLVLVITGKGREETGFALERRGILRRQVPHWLETPPLVQAVLEVRTAHRRHGGSGAYYVYLRRRQ